MTTERQNRTVKILDDHHDQIVAFARTNYKTDGRGVIQVGFPNASPVMAVVGVRMMKYITIGEMRRIMRPGDEETATLVRMIETYDPALQAVVIAAIDGENPVSVKMKLERPLLVDEAEGIH